VIGPCGSRRGMAVQLWVTWLKEERARWILSNLGNIGWEEREACNWALSSWDTAVQDKGVAEQESRTAGIGGGGAF